MKPTLLVLCILLAACTSNSANPKVRIANPGAGLQTSTMPISLAQALGYFREEGVDVEVENLPSVVKTMQALVGGSVDVAAIIYVQVIQMAAEGQHIR